jgi:FtsZ-binding cell division protein ZapB
MFDSIATNVCRIAPDHMQLEAQELKEKEGKEGQEGSESQEDTDEAKTEGQDVQGTQQPEGAKAKSRVLASVGDGMQGTRPATAWEPRGSRHAPIFSASFPQLQQTSGRGPSAAGRSCRHRRKRRYAVGPGYGSLTAGVQPSRAQLCRMHRGRVRGWIVISNVLVWTAGRLRRTCSCLTF